MIGQFKDAARASYAALRAGTLATADPLRALIPGDGGADPDTLATVEAITGRPVAGVNLAPAARVALRRWAARTETTH